VGSSTWGLQFHPEFDAEIMKAYLDEYADLVRAAGKNPSFLKRSTRDTPISRSILRRFAGIVRERS
jgi:GMP synthase (glutamine-hydrolysing)